MTHRDGQSMHRRTRSILPAEYERLVAAGSRNATGRRSFIMALGSYLMIGGLMSATDGLTDGAE